MWAGTEKAASDYVLFARSKVRQNGADYAATLLAPDTIEEWMKRHRWKYKLTDEEFIDAQARALKACTHIYRHIKRDLGEQVDLL